jgi:hypothetical protein
MKTTTAYLAGLGTTAILIGSILIVLFLGSGVMAFDSPPAGDPRATLDRVVIRDNAGADRSVRVRARREQRRRG